MTGDMVAYSTSKAMSNSDNLSGLAASIIIPKYIPMLNTTEIMVNTTKNPSKMSVWWSVILVSLYSRDKRQNTIDSAIVIMHKNPN